MEKEIIIERGREDNDSLTGAWIRYNVNTHGGYHVGATGDVNSRNIRGRSMTVDPYRCT